MAAERLCLQSELINCCNVLINAIIYHAFYINVPYRVSNPRVDVLLSSVLVIPKTVKAIQTLKKRNAYRL